MPEKISDLLKKGESLLKEKEDGARTPEVEAESEEAGAAAAKSEQEQLEEARKSLRRSSVSRVVGPTSKAAKERILEIAAERFGAQEFEDIEGKEREKTAEEIEIISLVNEATNKLREKYGLAAFDIPPKIFHVIKKEEWWRKEDAGGFYHSPAQTVMMEEEEIKLKFMRIVLHEMLHFKSYNAWQAAEGASATSYRVGLVIHKIGERGQYFNNLNEAVTEELAKRLFGGIADHPIFEQERRQTKKIIGRTERIETEGRDFIPKDDIVYARREGGKTWKEKLKDFFTGKKEFFFTFSYGRERAVLNALIDKLFEKNQDKFKEREEVFNLFVTGYMTGNIMPLGRLIEKTFGKGTLRRLGEAGRDLDEQEKFVDSL